MGSRVNGGKNVARRKGNFCIHRNNAFTFTSLKKNLFIVGLEIRRESDSFDRSDQIPIFSFLSFPSFFFPRPITFIRSVFVQNEFFLFFFFLPLLFNNRNGRHPEINVSSEGSKSTRASFVTGV